LSKRQTIALFSAIGIIAGALSLALHLALVAMGIGWAGWLLDAVVASVFVVITYGSFSPNATIWGRVIHGRGVRERVMALTFDDGPSPDTTPQILDALKQADARATFFVLGKHAERHPELIARMCREGHEVASHGWSHRILVFVGPGRIRRELSETAAAVRRAGATQAMLFRAPHGFRGPVLGAVAAGLGYQVMGWTTGVFDTARPGATVITERSRAGMHPGSILLLHDGDGNGHDDRSQTAAALPAILREIRERDLVPVTVSELAAREPRRVRHWWRSFFAIAGAAAAAAAAIYLAGIGSIHSSVAAFAGVNIGLVAAAVAANLLSIALKAVVWQASIDSVPERPPVRYTQVVAAILIGFLMNSMFVARVGEVGRALILRRNIERDTGVRVPLGTIAATIVSETLVLGATLVMLLALMLFTVRGLPANVIPATEIMFCAVGVLVLGAIAVEALSRRRWPEDALAAGSSHGWRRWVSRLEGMLHELSRGLKILRQPQRFGLAMAAGITSWIANLAAIWCLALAFNLHSPALAVAVVVFAVSNLIGVIQFTPGNVGVFQVAIALALSQSYGVDRTLGITFGIALQAVEVGLGAGLGLLCLMLEGISLGQVRRDVADALGSREGILTS
jgi:uncharacterized protein (TIRG00374 family)